MVKENPVPEEAKLVTVPAGGLAVYNVSHLLARHPRKRYPLVQGRRIDLIFTHHSGAFNGPGMTGLEGMSRWIVNGPWSGHWASPRDGRNWAGNPYHIYLSNEAIVDKRDRLAILMSQPFEVISWHTGGVNDHALGVCWEGNLTRQPPEPHQYEMAEGLYPWLQEVTGVQRDRFSMHNEAGFFGGRSKRTCPGPYVTKWVKEWRAD